MQEVLEHFSRITFGLLKPSRATPTEHSSIRYSVDLSVDLYVDGVFITKSRLMLLSIYFSRSPQYRVEPCVCDCAFWDEKASTPSLLNSVRKTGSLLQINRGNVTSLTAVESSVWRVWATDSNYLDEMVISANFEEFRNKELQDTCKKYLNT